MVFNFLIICIPLHSFCSYLSFLLLRVPEDKLPNFNSKDDRGRGQLLLRPFLSKYLYVNHPIIATKIFKFPILSRVIKFPLLMGSERAG